MQMLDAELLLAPAREPTTWVVHESTVPHPQPLKTRRRKASRARASPGELGAHGEAATQDMSRQLRPDQAEALRLKREPRDPSVACLEPEDPEGNVEYKLRIKDPHPLRLQQLITQLKFRLSEGNGECFYYIGVEDNGYPKGLEPPDLAASIATLHSMAAPLGAVVGLQRGLAGAWGRAAALLRVAAGAPREAAHTDLRVVVAGAADAGKSSLVAVLTHGAGGRPLLDNGRGRARLAVFRHKHEMQSGRTSSISHQLLGYDAGGRVINYATPAAAALTPAEITSSAAKVLTFLDMGGHEKYLKTALYGMTALLPDFSLLAVCAAAGPGRIGREHLGVAVALEVPVAVVVTKVELVRPERFAAVVAEVRQLVALTMRHEAPPPQQQEAAAAAGAAEAEARRVEEAAPLITTDAAARASARILCRMRADALATPTAWGALRVHMPIFGVSAVTGAGLPLLHAFLSCLQPAAAAALRASASAPALACAGPDAADGGGGHSSGGSGGCCTPGSATPRTPHAQAAPHSPAAEQQQAEALVPAGGVAPPLATAPGGLQQQLLYASADALTPAAAQPAPAAAAATTPSPSPSPSPSPPPVEAQAVHVQVDGTYEVEGVGAVLSGTVVSGTVRLGQVLAHGPAADGSFARVRVRQLQRSHVPVQQVRSGQTCTMAISAAEEEEEEEGGGGAAGGEAAGAPQGPLGRQWAVGGGGGGGLVLGSSPRGGPAGAFAGVAAMAAGAAGGGGGGGAGGGFDAALAAAAEALDFCLGVDGGGEGAGGGDDDLFGLDLAAEDVGAGGGGAAAAAGSRCGAAAATPPPLSPFSYGGGGGGGFRALHSTTSFSIGGGVSYAPGGAGGSASNDGAAGGGGWLQMSTSAPPGPAFGGAAGGGGGGTSSCDGGFPTGLVCGWSPRPPGRKGSVLLEPALRPRACWTFEAVLILLGGHWPPRGLLSGRWPPASGEEEGDGGGAGGGSSPQAQPGGSDGEQSEAAASAWARPPSRVSGGSEGWGGGISDAHGSGRSGSQTPTANGGGSTPGGGGVGGPAAAAEALAAAAAGASGTASDCFPGGGSDGGLEDDCCRTGGCALSDAAVAPGCAAAAQRRGRSCDGGGGAAAASGCGPLARALGGAGTQSRRRRQQRTAAAGSYATVVHCGSVRQAAQVLMVQELPEEGGAPALTISASTRAAAALLHAAQAHSPTASRQRQAAPGAPGVGAPGARNGGGEPAAEGAGGPPPTVGAAQPRPPHSPHASDLGCLVCVRLRWLHHPEWLREGAKLLVRDRADGRVAGAGFVKRVLL